MSTTSAHEEPAATTVRAHLQRYLGSTSTFELAGASTAKGRVLRVGPGREYQVPSEAAAIAGNGDTIEIDAGVYDGDVAVWTARGLTIRGVGGMAHVRAQGNNARGKAIWVVQGNKTTVENIEFSGATVPDRNGAGIRAEGKNLTVRNCYFHDNENGILAGDYPKSKIIVEYSVFENNGAGKGFTHNIYVNNVKRFIFRYNYTHGTRVGHNIKSRAKRSDILYNRISDENDGTASYGLDLPSGGLAYVIGNVIQQGPATSNSIMVFYGAEGLAHKVNELHFVNNTLVNDLGAGTFLRIRGALDAVSILNNLFAGQGGFTEDSDWNVAGNLVARQDPGFVDIAGYDYHLLGSSAAVGSGVDPGSANGTSLNPRYQYVHMAAREKRATVGAPDTGAYELQQ